MQKIFSTVSHWGTVPRIDFDLNKLIYLHVPLLYCVAPSFFTMEIPKKLGCLNKSRMQSKPNCVYRQKILVFLSPCSTVLYVYLIPSFAHEWLNLLQIPLSHPVILSAFINEPLYLWNVRGCALWCAHTFKKPINTAIFNLWCAHPVQSCIGVAHSSLIESQSLCLTGLLKF